MRFARLGAWTVSSLLLASTAHAQSPTGSIRGAVKSNDGEAIPGVTVLATSLQTGDQRSAATGAQGTFVLPALPVGGYRVTFQLEGFKEVVWPDVEMQAAV